MVPWPLLQGGWRLSRNNFGKNLFFGPKGPCGPTVGPHSAARAALFIHQPTTGTGTAASRRVILRLGNHKKQGVAGGLGALGMRF